MRMAFAFVATHQVRSGTRNLSQTNASETKCKMRVPKRKKGVATEANALCIYSRLQTHLKPNAKSVFPNALCVATHQVRSGTRYLSQANASETKRKKRVPKLKTRVATEANYLEKDTGMPAHSCSDLLSTVHQHVFL